MKKYQLTALAIFLGCLFTISQGFGQKMELILTGGSFSINNQRDFPQSRIGTNINFGMHYHLSDKWIIGTNYNLGHFSYVNPPLENTSIAPSSFTQKGKVQQENFSFLAIRKFRLPIFDLRLELGTGLGMYFQRDEYYRGMSYDPEIKMFRGIGWVRDRNRGLHFPVNYSLKKSINDRVVLGISGGQFFSGRLDHLGGYQGISFGFIF